MNVPMHNNSYRLFACLLVISLGLVACGKHGDKKEATQVAAKVNGAEISVHQINQVLSHAPGVTQENADKARKEILERLIVQEIAVAKATEAKLDRSPEVMMALEAARRDVLARAYLNQVGSAAAKVGADEVKRYFNEHSELFAQRRIYSLQDIALQRDEKLMAPLQEMVSKNKPMQEIAGWLKENNAKFKANADVRAAEQLPLELLPKVAKLADGQTIVVDAGQVVQVIHLVVSKQEPVDLATATPRIQQYLGNQQGQQAISSEMKKLRDAAKVEYLGEFAAEKQKQSTVPVPAPAPVEDKPVAPAQAKQAVDESIAKGAAGLK
jgi:EpsD family peptidyl-prolyl cis-trans isomerase